MCSSPRASKQISQRLPPCNGFDAPVDFSADLFGAGKVSNHGGLNYVFFARSSRHRDRHRVTVIETAGAAPPCRGRAVLQSERLPGAPQAIGDLPSLAPDSRPIPPHTDLTP